MDELFWRDLEQIQRKRIFFAYSLLVFFGILVFVCALGWYRANLEIIISIPPQIPYGYSTNSNQKHPSEVFTFAGFIWQQLHIWQDDGAAEGFLNIRKLSTFITPAAQKYFSDQHKARLTSDKLKNRTRTVQPTREEWSIDKVVQISPHKWKVELDQEIIERYNGVEIKSGVWRFYLTVIRSVHDPEKNPWQLQLDIPHQPAIKI